MDECAVLIVAIVILLYCSSRESFTTNNPEGLQDVNMLQKYYTHAAPYEPNLKDPASIDVLEDKYIIGYEDRTPYASGSPYYNNGALYHIPEPGASYVQEYSRGPKDNHINVILDDEVSRASQFTRCNKYWKGTLKIPENMDAWGRSWLYRRPIYEDPNYPVPL